MSGAQGGSSRKFSAINNQLPKAEALVGTKNELIINELTIQSGRGENIRLLFLWWGE
jgi:hypothetical protein